jgi:hypothetical protein
MTREDTIIYLDLILPQMTKDGWDSEYRDAMADAIAAYKGAAPGTERVGKDELILLRAKALVLDKERDHYRAMTGASSDALAAARKALVAVAQGVGSRENKHTLSSE